jgi:foldase protein PrsA
VGVRRDRRFVAGAVLAAQGIGHPSPSSGEVAVVQGAPDGHITVDQFNAGLKQTSLAQGLQQVPKTTDPQYATLRDTTMANLITSRWIAGEAADRGITASNTDIQNWIKQNIGGPAAFKKQAKAAGFTPAAAREQARFIVLGQELQKVVIPTKAPSVSEDLIHNFYEANKSQFTQPETRDVREILNKDKSKVDQAKSILAKDDSPASWKKVAAKYSTDKATKSNGGLRQGVAQGQSEPALDQQISSAPTGQLVGPFKGQAGWYLIEVEKVTPASVTPLSKLESQIRQQLAQGEQQQIASAAQKSITDKWTSRTFCASGYVVQQCANYMPPQATATGAPPVTR